MSKRGLPADLKMRHDWHYVEELSQPQRSIGRMIAIEQIEPNPEQPRVEIGDLSELTASIKEKGVLEPLLVKPLKHEVGNKPRWLIIAGERRWRAAQAAGLREVPCVELNVDDNQVAEIALIENLQRKDLSIWEESDGLAALCQRFKYTHEEVARKIGKSRSTVTESLTIANLPGEVRRRCREAGINSKAALLQIARQLDDAAMFEMIQTLDQSQQRPLAAADSSTNLSQTSASEISKISRPNDKDQRQAHRNGDNLSSENVSFSQTDLSHPVRAYKYQPTAGDFKLAINFRKPVNKQELISTLRSILETLENTGENDGNDEND